MDGLYQKFGKRMFDIFFSIIVIIILSPIFFLTSILILLEDGYPIFFQQDRYGAKRIIFILYKFRSMPINTPDLPSALMKGVKTTLIGKIIRRTNIDELPQLINILRGHMSIVGPRPALANQVDLIKMRTANHSINLKPGLTGLAQINSYNNMSENEKSKFDGIYAGQYSFRFDLIIIFHTFKYLLKKPPVY
jgi:O-antigen biosynthesis protein WbqP